MSGYVHIDANKYKDIWMCSDVHNDFYNFKKAVDELSIDKNGNLLIIAGDLLDRGLRPNECIQFCLNGWTEDKSHECDVLYLMGNHEKMLIDYIASEFDESVPVDRRERYHYNTIELLQLPFGGTCYSDDDIRRLRKLLIKLPLLCEVESDDVIYRIAHAAVPDDTEILNIDMDYVLWGDVYYSYYYDEHSSNNYTGTKKLCRISGHVPTCKLRKKLKCLTGNDTDSDIWVDEDNRGNLIIDIDCGNGIRAYTSKDSKLGFLNLKTMETHYF